jgi:hypothetical protein
LFLLLLARPALFFFGLRNAEYDAARQYCLNRVFADTSTSRHFSPSSPGLICTFT